MTSSKPTRSVVPAKGAKRPSLKPQGINTRNWYYEGAKSIIVVHEVTDQHGEYLQTDQFRIPWRRLMKSAHRCNKSPAP